RTPPPRTPPFPYTTLFRSAQEAKTLQQSGGPLGAARSLQQPIPAIGREAEVKTANALGRDAALGQVATAGFAFRCFEQAAVKLLDRKSTRLNSSHQIISYA